MVVSPSFNLRRRRIFISTMTATFISSAMLYQLTPFFLAYAEKSVGASPKMVGLIFSAMPFASFMAALPTGHFVSIYGSQEAMQLGLLLLAVASLAFGLSNSIFGWLFWRMMQGIATAPVYTAITVDLADEFDGPGEFGWVIGWQEAVASAGFAVGPLLGGVLYQWGGFLAPFAASAVVHTIFVICAFIGFPEKANADSDDGEAAPSPAVKSWGLPWGPGLPAPLPSAAPSLGAEAVVAAGLLEPLMGKVVEISKIEEGKEEEEEKAEEEEECVSWHEVFYGPIVWLTGACALSTSIWGAIDPVFADHFGACVGNVEESTVGMILSMPAVSNMLAALCVHRLVGASSGVAMISAGLFIMGVCAGLLGLAEPSDANGLEPGTFFQWTTQILLLNIMGFASGICWTPVLPEMVHIAASKVASSRGQKSASVWLVSPAISAIFNAASMAGEAIGPSAGGLVTASLGFQPMTSLISVTFVLFSVCLWTAYRSAANRGGRGTWHTEVPVAMTPRDRANSGVGPAFTEVSAPQQHLRAAMITAPAKDHLKTPDLKPMHHPRSLKPTVDGLHRDAHRGSLPHATMPLHSKDDIEKAGKTTSLPSSPVFRRQLTDPVPIRESSIRQTLQESSSHFLI